MKKTIGEMILIIFFCSLPPEERDELVSLSFFVGNIRVCGHFNNDQEILGNNLGTSLKNIA